MKDLLPDLLSSRSNESYENDMGVNNFDIEPMPHNNVDDFFLEINDMQQSLSVLKDLIKDIKEGHANMVKAPSQEVKEEDKKGLEELVNKVQCTMTQLRSGLKDLNKCIKELEKSRPGNYSEIRIKKNQHAALSKELSDIISEYETIQSEEKNNIKNKLIKLLGDSSDSSSSSDSDSDGGGVQETRDISDIQEDMEATREDILDLENKIKSLHELFDDIHIFVESQGDLIDSIEHNVAETASHVEQAIVDTKKAVRYQGSARKKQVIIVLCCLGILAAILIPVISQTIGH